MGFQRQDSIARQDGNPVPGGDTGLLQSGAESVHAILHL